MRGWVQSYVDVIKVMDWFLTELEAFFLKNPEVASVEGLISNLFYLSLEVGQGKTYKRGTPEIHWRKNITWWESEISPSKIKRKKNKILRRNSETPFSRLLRKKNRLVHLASLPQKKKKKWIKVIECHQEMLLELKKVLVVWSSAIGRPQSFALWHECPLTAFLLTLSCFDFFVSNCSGVGPAEGLFFILTAGDQRDISSASQSSHFVFPLLRISSGQASTPAVKPSWIGKLEQNNESISSLL